MWRRFISIPMAAGLMCYLLGAQEFGMFGYYDHAFKELSQLPQRETEASPKARAFNMAFHGLQAGGFWGFIAAYLASWLAAGGMHSWHRPRPWLKGSFGLLIGLIAGGVGGYLGGYLDACCFHVF